MWNIVINLNLRGNLWNVTLTASEASVLTMLRAAYTSFESQIKDLAEIGPGKRPAGLLDDALVLLRCLVFNRLEIHNGQHVNIRKI